MQAQLQPIQSKQTELCSIIQTFLLLQTPQRPTIPHRQQVKQILQIIVMQRPQNPSTKHPIKTAPSKAISQTAILYYLIKHQLQPTPHFSQLHPPQLPSKAPNPTSTSSLPFLLRLQSGILSSSWCPTNPPGPLG